MNGADYLSSWGFTPGELDEIWQRRPSRSPGQPGRFRGCGAVEWEEVSIAAAARAEILTVHLDGVLVSASTYSRRAVIGGHERDGLLDSSALDELVGRGATIIAANVEEYLPAAGSCALELGERFDTYAEAHVFATPPKVPGIHAHADGEDNFLLQLQGEKRWEVWPPQQEAKMHYERSELGAPSLDIVLTAGDALYIPMGWPHHGHAGEVGSLHITYQVLPSEDPG